MHLLGFDHQTEDDYNFVIRMQNKALGEVCRNLNHKDSEKPLKMPVKD